MFNPFKDEDVLNLLEMMEYESERFLLNTSDSVRDEKAEKAMSGFFTSGARLADLVLTRRKEEGQLGEGACGMIEIDNRIIATQSGAHAQARVGVNNEGGLMLLLLPPTSCDHAHVFIGCSHMLQRTTVHRLQLLGFTPRGMVTSFRQWAHNILVSRMATMPGGEA